MFAHKNVQKISVPSRVLEAVGSLAGWVETIFQPVYK